MLTLSSLNNDFDMHSSSLNCYYPYPSLPGTGWQLH